jgi:hypothetical protein
MASRWVKAAFLAVLGIIILFYTDKFVQDLRTNIEGHSDFAFTWTWDLLRILLWILVAWLFVDAALTVALSFTEHRYSLSDVMLRLQKIEKRLGVAEPRAVPKEVEPVEEAESEVEEISEEEVPPPPRE